MFIILGLLMMVTAIVGFSVPAIRRIDAMTDALSSPLKVAARATGPQAEMAAGN